MLKIGLYANISSEINMENFEQFPRRDEVEKITSREEFQIEGIEFTHDRQAHRLIGYDTEGQKWIAPFNPDTGEVGHFSGSQKNGLPRERFLDLRRIFTAAGQ